MKVTSSKQFEKHLKNSPSDIQKRFVIVYDRMIEAEKFSVLRAEKLTGFESSYRIRIGHYRLGFHFTDDKIELLALLHRKEIYRFFP